MPVAARMMSREIRQILVVTGTFFNRLINFFHRPFELRILRPFVEIDLGNQQVDMMPRYTDSGKDTLLEA